MHKYWSGETEKEKQGKHHSELSDRNTENSCLDGLMVSSNIKMSLFLSKHHVRSLSYYLVLTFRGHPKREVQTSWNTQPTAQSLWEIRMHLFLTCNIRDSERS